jgi:hypothetical protein
MIFTINKNSTLPLLKMELIKDGRNDFNKFHTLIQNSIISFSMWDAVNGQKRISCRDAFCMLKETCLDCEEEEYYLAYQFSEKETSKPGVYVGEFTIDFLDGSGKLIVPIKEKLEIHILETAPKR